MHVSTILKDAVITDMVWDGKATRLFFGDDQGRIAVSYMPKVCRTSLPFVCRLDLSLKLLAN